YVESAAAGLLAAINAARVAGGAAAIVPPATTALGSLMQYITDTRRREFQPMNANYGLLPPIATPERGREKRRLLAARAGRHFDVWVAYHGLELAAPTAATGVG